MNEWVDFGWFSIAPRYDPATGECNHAHRHAEGAPFRVVCDACGTEVDGHHQSLYEYEIPWPQPQPNVTDEQIEQIAAEALLDERK